MGKAILSCVILWLSLAMALVAESRLPSTYTPTQYNLLLTPNIEYLNYSGTVEIRIETSVTANESELSIISLHKGNSIVIFMTSLTDSSQKEIGIKSNPINYADTQIFSMFPKIPLTKGSTYTLKMSFIGKIRRDNRGFFIGSYPYDNTTKKYSYYMGANFYPIYARLMFPCFDEPQFNAIFNVRITRISNQIAVFNTAVASTVNGTGFDTVIDTFTTTPKMSPHSLSFFVIDSESILYEEKILQSGTVLKLWKPKYLAEVRTLKLIETYLNYLEIATGVNHPLGLQNIVFLPGLQYEGFGGFGIIFLREDMYNTYYGYNEQQMYESMYVIFGQLLRQYFSNYVSPSWWSDIWLTESVVTYFTYSLMSTTVATGNLEVSSIGFDKMLAVVAQQKALSIEMAHDEIYPLVEDEQISSIRILGMVVDDLKKLKGAAVLNMLDTAFAGSCSKTLLRTYLNRKQFSTSSTSDFLELISENDPTFSGMESWFTKTGYPVVSVSRNGSNFILHQESSDHTLTTWKIPITYANASQPNTNWVKTSPEYWLTTSGLTFTNNAASFEWMIFNKKSAGYYRVQYGTEDLQLIQNQLRSNYTVIDEINHAAIIDDLMYSVKTGAVSYKTALKFLMETSSHTRYFVWVSTLNALKFLKLSFYGQRAYDEFRMSVKYILKYPYGQLQYYRNYTEDTATTLLRGEILPWACDFEIGDCVSSARILFDSLLNGIKPSTPMPAVYDTNVMMCQVFKSLNETQFDYYLDYYKANHKKNTTQYLIASGLGCTNNTINLHSILFEVTYGNIYAEDVEMVFANTYLQLENVDAVLNHITNKSYVTLIQLQYGLPLLQKLYHGIGRQIHTEDQFNKLKAFSMSTVDFTTPVIDRVLFITINSVLSQVSERLTWVRNIQQQAQPTSAGNRSLEISFTNSVFMLILAVIILNLTRKL